MLLSLWISVAFFFFGEYFAIIFFGVKFTLSGTILAYSAPFLVMNFLLQINFAVLAGTGRVKDRARILGLCLGINILLNYILIKYI
jgi:O-antigen/teichoic acid export membrane protein